MERSVSSRSRRRSRIAAFTLLEIVLFIAIVALMVGALVPLVSGSWKENKLLDARARLEIFARTARSSAVLNGQPSTVRFFLDGFELNRASNIDPEEEMLDEAALLAAEFATDPEDENEQYQGEFFDLPDDTQILIQRWTSDQWIKPEEPETWLFLSSGLCEPLRVRLTSGESWIEVKFSPLTAEVTDESYTFQ